MHFGDIDAGGFWIHKKLCEQTNINFKLFHMGKEDLKFEGFSNCLRQLTELDNKRLERMLDDVVYSGCVEYMIKNQVKLEQEIISLYIQRLNLF